jgi:glutaminyl-peptide cyclotransferase
LSTTSPEGSHAVPRYSIAGGPAEPAFAGDAILKLVEEQVALGPRVPGSEAHRALVGMLAGRLEEQGAEVTLQEFSVDFRGRRLECRNIVGVFRAQRPQAGPLLLGTHFDCRFRADRERDPSRREQPIPGANDGGSGTAVLQHMLPGLAARERTRDVVVAFLDAEDLGNIDGKDFALGAEWLAAHPLQDLWPSEVIVLDMVGGRDMILDVDAHVLGWLPSRRLTSEIFRLGTERDWQPFVRDKKDRLKYIISDHTPFGRRGIPACILIDIDYPQWHTQEDLPGAMSAESLGIIEEALWLFLEGPRA